MTALVAIFKAMFWRTHRRPLPRPAPIAKGFFATEHFKDRAVLNQTGGDDGSRHARKKEKR